MRKFIVLLLLGCACSTAGQDEDDGAELDSRLHAGQVAGSDIVIGAVVQADTLTTYICGGDQSFSTHTRWFHNMPLMDNAFQSDDADWSIRGTIEDDSVTGTLVDFDGVERPFAIATVHSASGAGLYTADVDGCTTGVVVWESGADAAAEGGYALSGQGVYCNSAAEFGQVIILEPLAFTSAGGIEVEAETPTGRQKFTVTPF